MAARSNHYYQSLAMEKVCHGPTCVYLQFTTITYIKPSVLYSRTSNAVKSCFSEP